MSSASPTELNLEEILKYMIDHGGRVTNHDLVKHFKKFLTNPDTRDQARSNFKTFVNTLATIKTENNVKWLVLKKKYLPKEEGPDTASEPNSSEGFDFSKVAPQDISYRDPPFHDNSRNDTPAEDFSYRSNPSCDVVYRTPPPQDVSYREPPPYKPPPMIYPSPMTPPISPQYFVNSSPSYADLEKLHKMSEKNSFGSHTSSNETLVADDTPPKVMPRRRSSTDKLALENHAEMKKSMSLQEDMQDIKENLEIVNGQYSADQKISVKERKQMFNRMASEGDGVKVNNNSSNRKSTMGNDEDDRASVVSLDRKAHEWILLACRGNYHALAKMLNENPKLAKLKDPATTAMHWACKKGDEDIVKLLAGNSRNCVNVRSKGGYTPLHISMQFRHENVFKLLVEVYDADPNIRDWSGRKPRQYLTNDETSAESYRKFKSKLEKKKSEKDLSFLRIGSLNARVKKTTEAFSNFLGVGSTRGSLYSPDSSPDSSKNVRNSAPVIRNASLEHLHKMWGSADNVSNDSDLMPPPPSNRRSRNSRTSLRSSSRSTPTTPCQSRSSTGICDASGDSDSDTAFGFDSAWKRPST